MVKVDNIISVKGLTKKFGDFTAVDNVSFSVKRGSVFAFLGPNGAGKTTTIKMLTTILDYVHGEVLINGHNPKSGKDEVRSSIGIVFQDSSLDDDLTAIENMDFHAILYNVPRSLRKKRIEQLLKFVGLWDKKNLVVKTFSGGMKRRLEIARGLIHHPKILFLDEPTLGLDPQTRNHLWKYIRELMNDEEMTVFLTTHYMEEADKIADKIAIIDHGKIVASGSSKSLKKETNSQTLEEDILKLTGHSIRDEEANSIDVLRQGAKMWRGKR